MLIYYVDYMTPANIIFIDISIYTSLIQKFITTLVFFNYTNTLNINFHKGKTNIYRNQYPSTQLIFFKYSINILVQTQFWSLYFEVTVTLAPIF